MRIVDLFKEKAGKPVISFEFSRPKSEEAASNLEKALVTLEAAKPDYVSVTFGAGGSTREGSFELLDKLKNEKGFKVVAYLAGVGLGPEDLSACLDKYKSLGIETIFIIRGDPPTWVENYQPHPEAFSYASDLLKFVKGQYDFCLGAAAYPEGHIEAESKEKDLEYVKLKQDQGAEYIVVQYFYDNQYFFDFVEKARAIGVTVPIVSGVMPIYTVKMMENLAKRGIETRPFFYPVHLMPPYHRKILLPVAEMVSAQGIILPSSANLSKDNIRQVCQELMNLLQRRSNLVQSNE